MQMFTEQEREHIRQELVSAAEADARITGAAHLGSAALGRLDHWSDIDLALCLAADADFNEVLVDWTQRLYKDHAAVANYDVRRGTILYRVFLLNSTLQVDLSFWHATEFRALGPKFLNEKIGRDCYFPDGPPRCIVCPIRVSSLGIARKALQAMEQDEAIVAPLFASAVMGLSVIDYNLQLAPSYVLDPLFAILEPLSTAELLPAGEAERYRSEDGTEILRVRRRQYFAAFQTFFCDLERVAQWLRSFQLVDNAPDGFRDEEQLDSIERRGFVCQGQELAGVNIEYRENKIRQIAFSIQFDPSKLVSLTDSDAKIDEMIQAVQHRSLTLRDEVESELRED